MKRSASQRYMTIAIFVTAIFVIADLVMVPGSNVTVSPYNALYLLKAVPLVAFFPVCAWIIRSRMPNYPQHRQALIASAATAIDNVGTFLMLFIPFSMASTLFMYLAANTSRSVMDRQLVALDAALGFDWLSVVHFANGYPLVATVLVFAYAALGYQVPLAILVHSPNRQRLLDFLAMLAISGLLTGMGMLAAPAVGAFGYFKPDPALYSHFTGFGGLVQLPILAKLHSSQPVEFLATKVVGIACFPSFHTALGILIAYSLRNSFLVLPIGIINAIMILATVPEGGHYLVDVLAGVVVALISIATTRAVSVGAMAESRNPLCRASIDRVI